MRDARVGGERAPGQSPALLALVIVAAGLSVILLGAWYMLATRVRAVENRARGQAGTRLALDELSTRIDRLRDQMRAGEEDRLSAKNLEDRLAQLGGQVAALKRGGDKRALVTAVEELKEVVRSLQTEVEGVRRLAVDASKRPLAQPSAPVAAGADPAEVDRLAGRVDDAEKRIAELARRPRTTSRPPPKINEAALRKLVEKQVQDQVAEELRKMRENWGRGRRDGRREGGRDGGGIGR
jgi:small-conductance mechanosensitive channel